MKKTIEECLIEATEFLSKEGGMPENMWHPEYGWLIVNGEPTEAGVLWYQETFKEDGKA